MSAVQDTDQELPSALLPNENVLAPKSMFKSFETQNEQTKASVPSTDEMSSEVKNSNSESE